MSRKLTTPTRTSNRNGPISSAPSALFPHSRPFTGTRSTPGTARPRTARPRTATSTAANEANVIAAVTEGISSLILRELNSRSWNCYFHWPLLSISGHRRMYFKSSTRLEEQADKISDSQTYGKTIHKLAVFDPVEVMICALAADMRLWCQSQLWTPRSPNCPV